jgi:hypothetical protein
MTGGKFHIISMKPDNVVEWKQTGPRIWTRVPYGESSSSKRPTRKTPSFMATPL